MSHFEITPHGSEMLIQHSNRWRDLPVLADNNQMVFRKEWNEFRRDRGFSLSGAESCWVKARRAWQLLIILARGKGGLRAPLLRHSQSTCRTAPSRQRPWDSRTCVRTDSSRSRQSDHPSIHVWENKKLSHPHSSVALLSPPPAPVPPHPFRPFLCHGWVWSSLMDTNMNTGIVTNTKHLHEHEPWHQLGHRH